MALSLFAVDEANLTDVLAEPMEVPKRRLFGFLPGKSARVDVSKTDEFIDSLFDFDLDASNPDIDDLDKAWDVIRVALEILHEEGVVSKAATNAVFGTRNAKGGPMGDFGWVPSSETQAIATSLEDISVEALETAIAKVPDDTYLAGVRDEGHDYFTDNFDRLRKFYRHATSSSKAIMLVIC
ncbi:MAG: DUF1877 family protein [Litorimonas sp.]